MFENSFSDEATHSQSSRRHSVKVRAPLCAQFSCFVPDPFFSPPPLSLTLPHRPPVLSRALSCSSCSGGRWMERFLLCRKLCDTRFAFLPLPFASPVCTFLFGIIVRFARILLLEKTHCYPSAYRPYPTKVAAQRCLWVVCGLFVGERWHLCLRPRHLPPHAMARGFEDGVGYLGGHRARRARGWTLLGRPTCRRPSSRSSSPSASKARQESAPC